MRVVDVLGYLASQIEMRHASIVLALKVKTAVRLALGLVIVGLVALVMVAASVWLDHKTGVVAIGVVATEGPVRPASASEWPVLYSVPAEHD